MELVPTADSLHGRRRKGITQTLFGEAELQYTSQGPMVQNQRSKQTFTWRAVSQSE